MTKRDELIAAMNPPRQQAWSPEAQELNLLLHDLAPPPGWQVAYELCDDDSPVSPNNRDVFDRERKPYWRRELARRRDVRGDDDAGDDVAGVPGDARNGTGHHVLLVLTHMETGAQMRRWVDRAALMAQRTPAAVQAHVDAAVADGEARVTRKRTRLAEAGARRPQ